MNVTFVKAALTIVATLTASVPIFAQETPELSVDSTAASTTLTELAGELPAVLKAADGPYIVTADIVVPPGRTVTIEGGVNLLFRNFTGLQVHGTLLAAGTKELPVAFTSEHDKKHGSRSDQEPAPYDWNGITITENAVGTKFEFCRIGYSLYGINALTEYFTIIDCSFRKNGKADLTIKGVKQEIAVGLPFTYQPLGEAPVLPSAGGPSAGKIAIRTSSVAVLVAGAAMGVWKALDYSQSNERYTELNDADNLANLRNPTIVDDWESAASQRESDFTMMIAGFGVAALGAIAFGVTFVF